MVFARQVVRSLRRLHTHLIPRVVHIKLYLQQSDLCREVFALHASKECTSYQEAEGRRRESASIVLKSPHTATFSSSVLGLAVISLSCHITHVLSLSALYGALLVINNLKIIYFIYIYIYILNSISVVSVARHTSLVHAHEKVR